MQKLVVIDYSNCSINIYDITNINSSVEDHIDSLGHNLNECYYMTGDNITINRFDLNNK